MAIVPPPGRLTPPVAVPVIAVVVTVADIDRNAWQPYIDSDLRDRGPRTQDT
jgi:hypothetical protein